MYAPPPFAGEPVARLPVTRQFLIVGDALLTKMPPPVPEELPRPATPPVILNPSSTLAAPSLELNVTGVVKPPPLRVAPSGTIETSVTGLPLKLIGPT